MNSREAEQFLSALQAVRNTGGRAASATVVRVHGSAYRREGTRMLVREDGTYECGLSAGCLEPAVADRAARVIATGEPALISYDLEDDSVWGLNIGCTGAVDIRIERIGDDEVTEAWLDVLARGAHAVLLTPLAGLSGRRIVLGSGGAVGRLSDPAVERLADERARTLLAAPCPASASEKVGAAEVFFEVNEEPPRLVVFGAGRDAIPLVRQAWTMGFSVTVVDPRAAYLNPQLFTGATLVLTPFDALDRAVTLPEPSYVLIMSHHLERDRQSLAFSLASEAAYVGVLGPRARFERLLTDLAREGVVPSPTADARVHSPVGLALGAETPEEVAVSILAEILAVRRGFAGGFLRGTRSSLHQAPDPAGPRGDDRDRPATRAFARS
jgi:xanthine/CO dehydrogenase XdhC/CoxF family maturation factor